MHVNQHNINLKLGVLLFNKQLKIDFYARTNI